MGAVTADGTKTTSEELTVENVDAVLEALRPALRGTKDNGTTVFAVGTFAIENSGS